MEQSILTSIKKLLGIPAEYEHFDQDLIMHINSVFMILNQLGVGPEEGFHIEDDTVFWQDYVEDPDELQAIKSYIHLKTKLLFDPPASGTIMECYKQMINEMEWRLNVAVDPKKQ